MNAPATAAAIGAEFLEIPLANIAPSETHIQQLRRKRYNMESLADLSASVSKLGIQQPGVVRLLPKSMVQSGLVKYELVAGERRWRAARQANLGHFPAIVRDLTDDQVLEIQLVENLQREDLHPLEEAAGYAELMKVGKLKKEQLGERVGKSRSWVYSRMNLLDLPEEAQEAMQAGVMDVSRALVVASVGEPNQQAKVLEMALERDFNNNPRYSVRQLRDQILRNRLTYPLKGAPFPTDDAKLLPDAGDCGACPHRTGNCDPDASDPDVCTKAACFHLKTKAHGDRRRTEVLEKGGKVLKGEDARKVSPSIKTVYGHVDLDLVCMWDEFPEAAPKVPDELLDDDHAYEKHPAIVAWRERESSWQPRTYRALLTGQKYESVLIDDPKTKLLRELVPFKTAQQLLKKVGIELPTYANQKRPTPMKRAPGEKPQSPEAKAKVEEKAKQEAAQQERENAIRDAIVRRVLEQVKAKHDGTFTVDELLFIADQALDDMPGEADSIWEIFKLKNPGWDVGKVLDKLSSKDLPKFITAGLVAKSLTDGYGRLDRVADTVCARLKIDRKKIEKEVRAAAAKKAVKK